MFFYFDDIRKPLDGGKTVTITNETNHSSKEYVIDREAGRGGLAITYIAYEKEDHTHWVALKELFPRSLEDAWAERREDGKIVIKKLTRESEVGDHEDIWADLKASFIHEVKMAEKAGALYHKDGSRVKQNNPDVLHVAGPYLATNQNYYLVIETYEGESLDAYINQGWESSDERGKVPNSRFSEVLGILKKVTRRLSKLHGDSKMYHLDLSTANTYVSHRLGGTELDPYIIDFGSAYLYDKREAATYGEHRFTCNPFSAPEVTVLAELQDEDCGYAPDASSDTYSIAGILFYAVLGQIYSAKMLFRSDWKEKIRSFYPEKIYGDFTETLIKFFEKGLASGQAERFRTAKKLLDELEKLAKLFEHQGLLSEIDPDERMSYLLLHRYPLYEYATNREMNVLCLGSGEFVRRMVLAMISTGQMLDKKLKIHIVSEQAERYRSALLNAAPELAKYSNLGDLDDNPYEYVTFKFENISFPFDDAVEQANVCDRIASAHSDCRYVVISLGSNNHNVDLARRYASSLGGFSNEKTIVHYYMGEDAANNLRSDVPVNNISEKITLAAFSEKEYAKEAIELGKNAFRVHYLYEKLSNPEASKEKALQSFMSSAYSQKSSAAAALHLKYKLASVGIIPKRNKSEKTKAIEIYQNALNTQKGRLLELEHRRWMMYMIADGYRQYPDMSTIDQYSFEIVEGAFNEGFKCSAKKYHHCIVPCSDSGVVLKRLAKSEWAYSSYEEIEQTGYDPLDKMSLKVHMLAGEKISRGKAAHNISNIVDNHIAPLVPSDQPDRVDEFKRTGDWIKNALKYNILDGLDERLASIKAMFDDMGKDISYSIMQLQKEFAVYVEYNAYADYKAPDEKIVDNLLWIYYAKEDIQLIKIVGNRVIDNIAPALLLEPQNVYYIGDVTSEQVLKKFFKGHGNNTNVFTEACESNDCAKIGEQLGRMVESLGKNAVIDVTGATELQIAAAIDRSMRTKTPVICCDSATQTVYGLRNFNEGAVYTLKNRISASEAYALFGAIENRTAESDYIRRLSKYIDKLWQFYKQHKDDWGMITAFFGGIGFSSEVRKAGLKIRQDSVEHEYVKEISSEIYEMYKRCGIEAILRSLKQRKIIKSYAVEYFEWDVKITIKHPDYENNGEFRKAMNSLFVMDNWKRGGLIDHSYQKAGREITISLSSEKYVHWDKADFNDEYNNTYSSTSLLAPLKTLDSLGLIRLNHNAASHSPSNPTVIDFEYKYPAVRDCLDKEGNILEAYIWCKAYETGYFDDVKANFTFKWSENSSVKNELDIILTKGLSTVVVSCKTAKFNKEHLYEVKYLADRFSVNSKPVIVYSSDKAFNGTKTTANTLPIRERAKEMGIYLIDNKDLDDGTTLGQVLVDIAEGTRSL